MVEVMTLILKRDVFACYSMLNSRVYGYKRVLHRKIFVSKLYIFSWFREIVFTMVVQSWWRSVSVVFKF